jgi:glucose-6-phosphate isomerase
MPLTPLTTLPAWAELSDLATRIQGPEHHLRRLLEAPGRLEAFSAAGAGLFYDYSRQRVIPAVMDALFELAVQRDLQGAFQRMVSGDIVNTTEGRAALHTAARRLDETPVSVAGRDVMPEIRAVRHQIREFVAAVHAGHITGSTGKPFRDIVVVGIGGSYLGAAFAAHALAEDARPGMRLHFLANVDIHNFGRVAAAIDPEATLWVVISKSYTTTETMANALQAEHFMRQKGLDPTRHTVTVTAKGSPGDDPSRPVLAVFHMFDFIGGRYSVTSAVGGVPLSLYLGYERFEELLRGAAEMDQHAAEAPVAENLPLLAALLTVWNTNFLDYPALGIIPYAEPLAKLPAHVQQLNMESNGKSVDREGRPLAVPTGPIVFGEAGTCAQHSFFQLAHQGRPFPIEFIGVVHPRYPPEEVRSKGVTNHQELWANLLAQSRALAVGKSEGPPERQFEGNRPSSTLLMEDLSPRSVGRLLSFYEARTVFEAFVWGINPFDQFGVELGKTMASGLRRALADQNAGRPLADDLDPIARFYLQTLAAGRWG